MNKYVSISLILFSLLPCTYGYAQEQKFPFVITSAMDRDSRDENFAVFLRKFANENTENLLIVPPIIFDELNVSITSYLLMTIHVFHFDEKTRFIQVEVGYYIVNRSNRRDPYHTLYRGMYSYSMENFLNKVLMDFKDLDNMVAEAAR